MIILIGAIELIFSFFAGVIAGFWTMAFFVLGKKDDQQRIRVRLKDNKGPEKNQ